MSEAIAPTEHAVTPQQTLAAILDSQKPSSLLVISLNPVAQLQDWANQHHCTLHRIHDADPLPALAQLQRVDMAIVADQLEYMTREAGAELVGLLRNLHTERLVLLYQSGLAPERLRWNRNQFLAMGLRRDVQFQQDGREMSLYSYELSRYNFSRAWNNSRFWANPENWGKYWW
ncbi:MAG: hypothetical protein CVV10_07765 [Gammaproteobacteria bacterium HGW-Gammaproteobacteria-14]|nr:MAG: hypothetical protein CVV10_07765 [Gammaproteobacteria bacterium HGW-Gammaproteobacteria-14]